MIHNDVARRTAPRMPARSLTPRTLACTDCAVPDEPTPRLLTRPLPLRALGRTETDG
ncbi:hypothetical protein [Kitasatospora terrestris]|uniref:Uncharacterized protein n=1 Tax=Kitasatospora terrestris TaxID=258051 RepID=A0ABP9DPM3_9ACTN